MDTPYQSLVRRIYGSSKPLLLKECFGPKQYLEKLHPIQPKEIEIEEPADIGKLLPRRNAAISNKLSNWDVLSQISSVRSLGTRVEGNGSQKATVYLTSKSDLKSGETLLAEHLSKVPAIARHHGNILVTMDELKKHCYPHDAWTVIHGVVFDIRDYIRKHPGGMNSMLKIMGKDGTMYFGR